MNGYDILGVSASGMIAAVVCITVIAIDWRKTGREIDEQVRRHEKQVEARLMEERAQRDPEYRQTVIFEL